MGNRQGDLAMKIYGVENIWGCRLAHIRASTGNEQHGMSSSVNTCFFNLKVFGPRSLHVLNHLARFPPPARMAPAVDDGPKGAFVAGTLSPSLGAARRHRV